MIKPEYINIPDTEFVPLTENEVRKDLAGLYEINKKGEVRNVKTKRILTIQTTKNYPRVNIINRIYLIHVLLAKKFIINDNPNEKIYVDHIDRDANNYSLENLRWVTIKENNNNRNKPSKNNYFYIKRKEINGPIIDRVSISSIEPRIRIYISDSMCKGIRYKGYYWEKVNIDVENKLKEFGITEKDLKFVKNKNYPGVEFSREGILKTRYGLTLGTLSNNYYIYNVKGKRYRVHRLIYETFSRIQLTSDDIIDHINTNSLDNRFCNLKIGTQKDNMRNPLTLIKTSKRVNQIDINTGKVIKMFSSISEAYKFLKKKIDGRITACCTGNRKTACGYKWEYADKQPDGDNN